MGERRLEWNLGGWCSRRARWRCRRVIDTRIAPVLTARSDCRRRYDSAVASRSILQSIHPHTSLSSAIALWSSCPSSRRRPRRLLSTSRARTPTPRRIAYAHHRDAFVSPTQSVYHSWRTRTRETLSPTRSASPRRGSRYFRLLRLYLCVCLRRRRAAGQCEVWMHPERRVPEVRWTHTTCEMLKINHTLGKCGLVDPQMSYGSCVRG